MHWLRKYWQAVASTVSLAPVGQEVVGSSLRVDVAGCRVYSPPVRKRQRAFYIPREHAASVAYGEEKATRYGTIPTANAAGIAQEQIPQSQNFTFDEFFSSSAAYADDVLFVPISPASVG